MQAVLEQRDRRHSMPLYRQHVEVTKSGKSEGTFLMCGSVELHQTGGEGSQTIPSGQILF